MNAIQRLLIYCVSGCLQFRGACLQQIQALKISARWAFYMLSEIVDIFFLLGIYITQAGLSERGCHCLLFLHSPAFACTKLDFLVLSSTLSWLSFAHLLLIDFSKSLFVSRKWTCPCTFNLLLEQEMDWANTFKMCHQICWKTSRFIGAQWSELPANEH